MATTPFSKRVEILGGFWFLYKDSETMHPVWKEFFELESITLSMSWASWQGLVTIKTPFRKYIEDTWSKFCTNAALDEDAKFDDLDHALDISGKQIHAQENNSNVVGDDERDIYFG